MLTYHEPVTDLDIMANIVDYSGTDSAALLYGVDLVPYLMGEFEIFLSVDVLAY